MAFIGDYNPALVQINVGSFRVTGWGADGGIVLAPMSDLIESEASADGSHVSITTLNDPRWEATITVRRNTPAYRMLMEAQDSQMVEAASGSVSPQAFQVYDPISGDKITEANARFTRRPDLGFEKSQSDAEFVLLLPGPTVIGGLNIPLTS